MCLYLNSAAHEAIVLMMRRVCSGASQGGVMHHVDVRSGRHGVSSFGDGCTCGSDNESEWVV
jgi:hypothetical protein